MQRFEASQSAAASIAAVETFRLPDGRVLCARRWGGSDEQSVVLLHGLLDSSEGWAPVCERLPGTRLAFDLPGFGFSDAPATGSVHSYARDVADGLASVGLKRFALVGHSFGGAVATALAELVPERVTGLVLLAPTGFGRVHLAEVLTLPGVREVVEAALPFALRSRIAVTLAYLTLVTSGSRPEAELVERVTSRDRSAVAAVRDATHAIASSGRGDDAFHRRRIRYDGPVRVIWGDRDRLVPAHHRHGVKAALPQADIELWKGMGHHPLRERLDELTRLIATVSRTDPRPLASALSDAA